MTKIARRTFLGIASLVTGLTYDVVNGGFMSAAIAEAAPRGRILRPKVETPYRALSVMVRTETLRHGLCDGKYKLDADVDYSKPGEPIEKVKLQYTVCHTDTQKGCVGMSITKEPVEIPSGKFTHHAGVDQMKRLVVGRGSKLELTVRVLNASDGAPLYVGHIILPGKVGNYKKV